MPARSRRASRPRYPPFGRLASLLVSGADKHATEGLCPQARGRRAASTTTCACSDRPKRRSRVVRGRHRFRLLVKSPRSFDLSAYLREWLAAAPKPQGQRSSSRSTSIRRVSCEPAVCSDDSARRCHAARRPTAAKISAKPIMSGTVGRSPSISDRRDDADHRHAQHAERGRHRRQPPHDLEPEEIGEPRCRPAR